MSGLVLVLGLSVSDKSAREERGRLGPCFPLPLPVDDDNEQLTIWCWAVPGAPFIVAFIAVSPARLQDSTAPPSTVQKVPHPPPENGKRKDRMMVVCPHAISFLLLPALPDSRVAADSSYLTPTRPRSHVRKKDVRDVGGSSAVSTVHYTSGTPAVCTVCMYSAVGVRGATARLMNYCRDLRATRARYIRPHPLAVRYDVHTVRAGQDRRRLRRR